MKPVYGLSYKGSKRKIAKEIIEIFPTADNFYDLFGGGGAVTCAALCHRPDFKRVFYNDIASDIVTLFQDSIAGKYSYQQFLPVWVSREEFHAKKEQDPYIKFCWSFGNNGKDYLFSPSIESYKRSIHNAVVLCEFDTLAKQALNIDKWDSNLNTITKRRLHVRKIIGSYTSLNLPESLKPFLTSKQLERLQQLEQLERLERLQQLQQLACSSLSFDDVKILPNSVVYCDIPYHNTQGYFNDFSHTDFYAWVKAQKFPVYFSSYEIEDPDFQLVWSKAVKTTFWKDSNNIKRQECLYWNGVLNV